ncbi:MAG: DUF885 domain-containing protein, partial [Verrucomicrobia bacterium]|nr:DUF885 domain-containing protein [Verrucomicrobiota bacterium]
EKLDQLAIQRRRMREMNELLPFRRAVQELEQTRWRMEAVNGQASASKIAGVPDQLKALRERIKQGTKPKEKPKDEAEPTKKPETTVAKKPTPPLKVTPALAARVADTADQIRGTLKNWFSYYDGYQPEFSWWLRKPYEDAGKAMEDYAKFLREEIAGVKGKDEDPLLGEPVGAAVIAQALRTEWIPYTADELIAIGEREFAWCEAELKKAAREMGLGDDWKAALEKMKRDFLPPGQQETLVAAVGREAIRFVEERNLITVPALCEEVWRLSMIPPKTQKTVPYASYGGQQVNIAYASAEMKHEDKLMAMRGNNRHFMRIVTPHELIPGHHLQNFMADRQRNYRRAFST